MLTVAAGINGDDFIPMNEVFFYKAAEDPAVTPWHQVRAPVPIAVFRSALTVCTLFSSGRRDALGRGSGGAGGARPDEDARDQLRDEPLRR